jgi:DNA polymerase-3 subunit alpha
MSLFDMGGGKEEKINAPTLPEIPEWDEKERLSLEKESLGFYMTGHPLDKFEDILKRFTNADTLSLKEKNDGQSVRIGGIVRNIKMIRDKKGDTMAFITTEDMHGTVETTVFSSLYAEVRDLLSDDSPILIEGELQKSDENSVKIVADVIRSMSKIGELPAESIHIRLDMTRTDRDALVRLHDIIKKHPGTSAGYIHLLNPSSAEITLALSDELKVKADAELNREISGLFGGNVVETVYQRLPAAASDGKDKRRARG